MIKIEIESTVTLIPSIFSMKKTAMKCRASKQSFFLERIPIVAAERVSSHQQCFDSNEFDEDGDDGNGCGTAMETKSIHAMGFLSYSYLFPTDTHHSAHLAHEFLWLSLTMTSLNVNILELFRFFVSQPVGRATRRQARGDSCWAQLPRREENEKSQGPTKKF